MRTAGNLSGTSRLRIIGFSQVLGHCSRWRPEQSASAMNRSPVVVQEALPNDSFPPANSLCYHFFDISNAE